MTVFFSELSGARLRRRCGPPTLDAYGRWCRALLAGGVYPPAVAVRGLVPVAGSTAERHRAHRRGGRARRSPRSRAMRSARRWRSRRCAALARRGRHAWPTAARCADADRARTTPAEPGPAQLAAAGPRAAGRERRVRAAARDDPRGRRGCTTAPPRVVRDDDPDLALLLGDQLYALGLARLADARRPRRGRRAGRRDLAASPRPSADGDAGARRRDLGGRRGRRSAGARAREHEAAKALARAGDPGARPLRRCCRGGR